MSVPPKLAKAIEALCAENGWNTRVHVDSAGRWARFTGFQQPAWAGGIAFLYDPTPEVLVVYVGHARKVPEGARLAMSEAITRANYGFTSSCLELDFANGDLRVRTALLVGAKTASAETVRNLVKTGSEFAARFFPAVDAVLAGEAPEAAMTRARAGG